MENKNFDIKKLKELIGYAYHCNKFYEEFIKSFNSYEAMMVSIKLAINIEDDKYCYYYFGYKYYYRKIIRDVGIRLGIYKNQEEFEKDLCYVDEFKDY